MAIIKNSQWKKIKELAKDGNEKAKDLIDHYMRKDFKDQDDLDRMVSGVFEINPKEEVFIQPLPNAKEEDVEEEVPLPVAKEEKIVQTVPLDAPTPVIVSEEKNEQEGIPPYSNEESVTAENIGVKEIEKEMDGLIDMDDIKDLSFGDFLKNKKRDALRAKKNHDYFAVFSPDGRLSYLTAKEDEYDKGFNTKRKDIERVFDDMDKSISSYALDINDKADDGIELDTEKAECAYSDIIDANDLNHSFGRAWDDNDFAEVMQTLTELMAKYGRKNVLAALNMIKSDNEAYKNFRESQISQAVSNYKKALEKLLK